ncbi:MAG: membrane protein insertase YidC [Porticoccaceae bacterium]|jgi:YidC/Oxa1 family membrane protein insertase
MDWQRNLLISAIIAVIAVLFIRWNDFKAEQMPPESVSSSDQIVVPEVAFDEAGEPSAAGVIPGDQQEIQQVAAPVDSRLITLQTDTLKITVDTYGGDIVRTELLQYPQSQSDPDKAIVILNHTNDHTYIAQSGLIGKNGTDTNKGRPKFHVSAESFYLENGEDVLSVDLIYRQGDVNINKQLVMRRGDYLIDINYVVANNSGENWQAGLFGQIQRDTYQPPAGDGFGMQPYLGAAITTVDENYKKISFSDLNEKAFTTEKEGGWVAMLQHYFVSAWIPDQNQEHRFTLKKLGSKDLYTLGFVSPVVDVAPGQTATLTSSFYVGPKDQYRLEKIAPYLDLTIDYGWLWWIAKPIFYLMTLIHSFVGNWGWSIILLTVLIKLAFFKLSATSYRSMAKMRKLQPEMARLKDLYGDDRQKLSQEMMAFYKKEKVNPMGGCLPILVQMPVFIALYWVLFESVELRHAPWVLWITDLSVKDPYFVLPVLNGICMYVTTLLQPEPPDPTQAKIMKIMPVAFSFMFAFFPAGLVLYWTVNSLLSIAQQWAITRQIEAKG